MNAASGYPVEVKGDQRSVPEALIPAVHRDQAVLGQHAESLVLVGGRQ
jgi:hypothetical protein